MADWFDQNAPGGGSYNFDQALDKVQKAIGRSLSGTEIDGLFQKFGGSRSDTFTDAGLKPVIDSFGTNGQPPPNYGGTDGTPPDVYKSNPDAPTPPPAPPPMATYVPPTWQGGDYTAPAKPTVLQSPYVAGHFDLPTQAELEASPGYLSRLNAGQLALDRSAAARGSVLNGGTQKATARYGHDYASNEYGNLVGQKLGAFGANESASLAARQENQGEYVSSENNAFRDYQAKYGQFTDAATLGLRGRQQNVSEGVTAFDQAQTGFKNRYTSYLDQNSRSLSDYLTNVKARRDANNDYWQHLNDLNTTGATTANNSYKYTGIM